MPEELRNPAGVLMLFDVLPSLTRDLDLDS